MRMQSFDRAIFLTVLGGVLVGLAAGLLLQAWAMPTASNYRPAVWSTVLVPLACLLAWRFSPSREGLATALLACLSLYILSAFAAARLAALLSGWTYFELLPWLQALAGAGLALVLARSGRAQPSVERLREAQSLAELAALSREGTAAEREQALQALEQIQGESARPALLAALDDKTPRVRQRAAQLLAGRAQPEDVPRLQRLLRDPLPTVRRAALETLRWTEGPAARQAEAGYWQQWLRDQRAGLWVRALPLFSGLLLVLLGLALPWTTAELALLLPESGPRSMLWAQPGGLIVALLLLGSGLLPPAELLVGLLRQNLSGHLERLRIEVFVLLVALALALLWPLPAPAFLSTADWSVLGIGFWLALAGAVLEVGGSFLIHT
ncbi:MAG: HEAT repeat domain-containing protein [Chloroflexia bacterium]|nr:HEAT repeat domain-containing protein [Chloroflexia bacterium]